MPPNFAPRGSVLQRDDPPAVRGAAEDHRKKTLHEASRVARSLRQAGYPAPLGDPASGVMLVVEQPVGPRTLEAIEKSLKAVNLPETYVTWSSTGRLLQEILIAQPTALVAVGPGAAQDLDDLPYPLSRNPFSEATPGAWFPWTQSTSGLLLPALAPALENAAAKKHFWRAFLILRNLPS